ncbi:DUF5996 family protein [Echinicola sediminis]
MMNSDQSPPSLPLSSWEDSKKTLHLYFQIVGKIALKVKPRRNHWWHVTLHVSPVGVTTGPMPVPNSQDHFEITFNFLKHRLEFTTSQGEYEAFELHEGLTVAQFKKQLFGILKEKGIKVNIVNIPFDLEPQKPFDKIDEWHSYDKEKVNSFWCVLRWVNQVFSEFSGEFYGKQCPVHLYWHHMDLAVTRFSGKKGPEMDPGASPTEKDAYSHEVISFGFWAGDDMVREPAFYSYTYPAPDGLADIKLLPDYAKWVDSNGSPMAYLSYEELRKDKQPRKALLEFLGSAYEAGAVKAGWDIDELTYRPFK